MVGTACPGHREPSVKPRLNEICTLHLIWKLHWVYIDLFTTTGFLNN